MVDNIFARLSQLYNMLTEFILSIQWSIVKLSVEPSNSKRPTNRDLQGPVSHFWIVKGWKRGQLI